MRPSPKGVLGPARPSAAGRGGGCPGRRTRSTARLAMGCRVIQMPLGIFYMDNHGEIYYILSGV
jgi:hypothetical protein